MQIYRIIYEYIYIVNAWNKMLGGHLILRHVRKETKKWSVK